MAALPEQVLAAEEPPPKMENALLIFAKKPELGKVKTRLAKDIGDEKALQVYKQLLFYTFDMAETCEVYVMACLTEKDQITLDAIPYSGFYKQEIGDLGQRMSQAMDYSTKKLGFKKTLIIGTDCPDISKEIIQEAFDNLDQHDFVLGPAEDGGYYLIGMKENYPYVFQNIDWSTERVLEQSISAIIDKENSFYLLPKLRDIDTLEDLKQSKFKTWI